MYKKFMESRFEMFFRKSTREEKHQAILELLSSSEQIQSVIIRKITTSHAMNELTVKPMIKTGLIERQLIQRRMIYNITSKGRQYLKQMKEANTEQRKIISKQIELNYKKSEAQL
jgi:predicted transcriptional regulator